MPSVLDSIAPRASQSNDSVRADGTPKGTGFLGVLSRPDGKVSTEISIGININGKEVQVPTLVPTLSESERQWLLTNDISDPSKIPAPIVQKAADFARQRIAAGKSPFASNNESPKASALDAVAPKGKAGSSITQAPQQSPAPATPERTTVDRAIDVAKGFGKGLATEFSGTAQTFGPIMDRIAAATFGRKPADTAPLDEQLKFTDATNRAQKAGKVMEFVASLAAPTVLSKAKGAVAAKEAATEAVSKMAARTGTGAAIEAPAAAVEKAAQTGTGLGTKTTTAPKWTVQRAADAIAQKFEPVATKLPTGSKVSGKVAQIGEQQPLKWTLGTDEAINKVAEEAGPDIAAKGIEQHVTQSVNELAQDMRRAYGSQQAGERLFPNLSRADAKAAIERLAPGPSRFPLNAEVSALDEGFRRSILSEKGGINPKLLASIGTGAAGAAAGASQGETPEQKLEYGVIGGVAGAVAVPLIAHAVASGTSIPKKMQSLLYSSILSSPQSVIKAYMGGVGGAIAAATEKIAGGEVKQGATILRELFSPAHVTRIVNSLRNPKTASASSAIGQNAPSFIGRIFDAANEPAVVAMMKGGVSREDAIRFTLSGAPTSPMGKDVLSLWNRWFPLRLATTLFPRVGVQVLERGLERSPLGLVGKLGLQTSGNRATQVGRAVLGPAAAVAAYEGGDQVPGWAKPYLAAASGVYALPVGAGMAVAAARQKGGNAAAQLNAGTAEFAKNLPFPQFGPAEAISPDAMASMAVPNIVRDVARARDPYERDTRKQVLGRARAKIPGLREQLPVKPPQVNLEGKPIEDRSSPVRRFFSPAATEGNPRQDVNPKVLSELDRLDVQINAPAMEKTLTVGSKKITVPQDVAERSRAERRQFLIPQLQKVIDSSPYQQADDAKKKRMIEFVIRQAESAGSARARATIVKALRAQGNLK